MATRKIDGTCCLMDLGILYKRREVKKNKPIPDGFIEADYDKITGKRVGWIMVDKDDPQDKYHTEAFNIRPTENSFAVGTCYADGTYELVGPKIQGNAENCHRHILLRHDKLEKYPNIPRSYEGLKEVLKELDIEGFVFHHPDGRMAKIKKKDFGMGRAL